MIEAFSGSIDTRRRTWAQRLFVSLNSRLESNKEEKKHLAVTHSSKIDETTRASTAADTPSADARTISEQFCSETEQFQNNSFLGSRRDGR